jgi:hypothetical protein
MTCSEVIDKKVFLMPTLSAWEVTPSVPPNGVLSFEHSYLVFR